ncbi:MAG: DUF4390 domain-containing protein [Halofilum sp. (in: g-proteobacteria)]
MSTLRRVGLATVAMLAVALPGAFAANGPPFQLRSVEAQEVDGVYLLDAVARLRLTPTVRHALHGGVGLVMSWNIEIVRERPWWLEAEVAELSQRYYIEYHELSLQYLVTNLNTGERRNFVDLKGALAHIGRLYKFPLLDRVVIEGQPGHRGRAQVRLDHGALPWALRPTALMSSAWSLESQWLGWSFE